MKKRLILVCVQIFLLFLVSIWGYKQEMVSPDLHISDWQAEQWEFDNTWHINEESYDNAIEADGALLSSPEMLLPMGTYTFSMEYESTGNHTCEIYSFLEIESVISNATTINPHKKSLTYNFTLKKAISDIQIRVKYSGNGDLRIEKVNVVQNRNFVRQVLALLVAIFIGMDLVIFCKKRIYDNKTTLFVIGSIVFAASLPLLCKGLHWGHDLEFHFMRIEGIAEGLKQGDFPVKLSSIWCDGYGYPVSIFYGDILLYFPALLRVIGVPITVAYKVFVIAINVCTVGVSYYAFRNIFHKKNIAYICTAVYTLATYRFVDLYVRASVGEYSAMIFLPFLGLFIAKCYLQDNQNKSEQYKNFLILVVCMSGLINTHILTLEMTCFILGLVALLFWKKTFSKTGLLFYGKAIVATLALNLFFLVPFLDYYRNVSVYIFDQIGWNIPRHIQGKGAYISQYFSLNENIFGKAVNDVTERMSLSIGSVLTMTLLVGLYLFICKKQRDRYSRTFGGLFVLCLWLSSDLFPWDRLIRVPGIGVTFSTIQYPWRFLALATLFGTMYLGQIIEDNKEVFERDIVCICSGLGLLLLYQVGSFTGSYNTNAIIGNVIEGEELNHFYMATEYMRTGTHTEDFIYDVQSKNVQNLKLLYNQGNSVSFYCETEEAPAYIEVPKLNYKRYIAQDDNGNALNVTDGVNHVVTVIPLQNYKGNIIVKFMEPRSWRLAELISLFSLAGFLGFGIIRNCRKNKMKDKQCVK